PCAVHGRRPRPTLPRILRHDLRGDSHLGHRLGDAHAHAVQPLLKAGHKPAEKGGHEGSRFARASESAFQSLLRAYDRTLQVVLRHRPATMVAFAVVLVLTAWLFLIVPKGFIPAQDTDQIAVTTEAA